MSYGIPFASKSVTLTTAAQSLSALMGANLPDETARVRIQNIDPSRVVYIGGSRSGGPPATADMCQIGAGQAWPEDIHRAAMPFFYLAGAAAGQVVIIWPFSVA